MKLTLMEAGAPEIVLPLLLHTVLVYIYTHVSMITTVCLLESTYSDTIEVGWFHMGQHVLQQLIVAVGVVLKSKAGALSIQV